MNLSKILVVVSQTLTHICTKASPSGFQSFQQPAGRFQGWQELRMNIPHPIPKGRSWQLKSSYCPVLCGCHSHLNLIKQRFSPLHPSWVTGDHLCIRMMCVALHQASHLSPPGMNIPFPHSPSPLTFLNT